MLLVELLVFSELERAVLAASRKMRAQPLLLLVVLCAADDTVDVAVDASGGQALVDSDTFAAAKAYLAELVASLTGGARTAPPDLGSTTKCASCVERTAQHPEAARL